MGIRTKFNLVLFAVAALAFALFAFVATPIFQAEKKDEILQQARLLMESAQAIRDYTSEEITPVLDRLQDEKFYPQSVAAYAAVHYFEALHKKIQNSPIGNRLSIQPIRRIARLIGKPTSSTISAITRPRPSW